MNRAIFITVGVIIIVIIFLVWLFLFINGAPNNTREVFSDLGIVGQAERTDAETIDDTNNATVLNLSDSSLEQVTTNPIAGFALASTSAGTILRYVERGTGYIFDINLNSSLQTQVTPSTVPNAIEAYFAPDLTSVVIVSEPNNNRVVQILELPDQNDTEAVRSDLGSDTANIEYLNAEQIAFTRNSYLATAGYVYDLETKTTKERFRLPIPDALVQTTESNNIFAYPKVTSLFEGALYEVSTGTVVPASRSERGLTAFIDGGIGVVSYIDNGAYRSYRLPNYAAQPILMLAEKCAATHATDTVVCGAPDGEPNDTHVENWYKGLVSSNDMFWSVNTGTGEAAVITIPADDIGRQVDVTNLQADPLKEKFFFQNKIDATLWLLNL